MFRVYGVCLGLRLEGSGLRIDGSDFRVEGLGLWCLFRLEGLGFRFRVAACWGDRSSAN